MSYIVYTITIKEDMEDKKMIKVTGLNELAQAIEYDEIIKTHEAKAKRAADKARLNELIAQGIDKEVAKVMVKVGL